MWQCCCCIRPFMNIQQYQEMEPDQGPFHDPACFVDLKSLPDLPIPLVLTDSSPLPSVGSQEEISIDKPKAELQEKKKHKGSQLKKNKSKIDRSKYQFREKNNETCVIHGGTLKAQPFNIQFCSNSNIVVFDRVSASFIDKCQNCNIFIGPVSDSLFVRDCRSCTIFAVSNQFRVRDCYDCKFIIHVATMPIIQASQRLVFRPMPKDNFSQLHYLMEQSSLDPLNNIWYQVYDFSKSQPPVFSLQLESFENKFYQKQLCKLGYVIHHDLFLQVKGPTHAYKQTQLLIFFNHDLSSNFIPLLSTVNKYFNVIKACNAHLSQKSKALIPDPSKFQGKVLSLLIAGLDKQQCQSRLQEWRGQMAVVVDEGEASEQVFKQWQSEGTRIF